jgi:hypothetical protein
VLLDSLSEPGDKNEAPYSLNSYLTARSDRVGFVGRAIGNVVATRWVTSSATGTSTRRTRTPT